MCLSTLVGGDTHLRAWGYPILGLAGGVPHPRSGWGVPHPRSVWGGYPIPGLDRGYSIRGLAGGYPIPGTPHTWDGVPPPRLGMRYPPGPGMGYPPDLGWGTPKPDLGWGTPPDLRGYPPTWDGVPPQHSEYLLRGGRYASCVHAGGLSCYQMYLRNTLKWGRIQHFSAQSCVQTKSNISTIETR